MAVYHMLLKALWFDHAAANITDYSIERIGFWTQSVQSHISLIQAHDASPLSVGDAVPMSIATGMGSLRSGGRISATVFVVTAM